jgi:hypothetical protein
MNENMVEQATPRTEKIEIDSPLYRTSPIFVCVQIICVTTLEQVLEDMSESCASSSRS